MKSGIMKKSGQEEAGEIDLTPMLDVVFILLIFFIFIVIIDFISISSHGSFRCMWLTLHKNFHLNRSIQLLSIP